MNRVNHPDILSIDSFMDTTTQTNGRYSTFVNHSPNTALVGAKKVHLLRASIPNCPPGVLPNYSLVFYYYKLPTATTIPAANYLKAVRLYPSDVVPGAVPYTQAGFYQTPQELVDDLNNAAGVDSATYNTLWTAGDVEFFYSTVANKIYWYGTDDTYFYCNGGYNDPIIRASQASSAIRMLLQDGSTPNQPFSIGYTLNLRCGFACDGVNIPIASGTNFLSAKCANYTGKPFADNTNILADAFPNLVYSQNVYVYSNIVVNSGYGSVNRKNLLAVVPLNVPIGGVAQYDGHSTPAYETKVASEIYSIDIDMRDDANEPFTIPDSGNVHILLNFIYE